jgi:hypothetical protein
MSVRQCHVVIAFWLAGEDRYFRGWDAGTWGGVIFNFRRNGIPLGNFQRYERH